MNKKFLGMAPFIVIVFALITNAVEGAAMGNSSVKGFASDLDLLGTCFTPDDSVAMTSSISSRLKISGHGDGFVSLIANIAGLPTIKCNKIPVIWEITRTPNGREVVTLDISDYTNRLYINIRILENGNGRVHVSTWTPTSIYNMKGEITNPRAFGFTRQRVGTIEDAIFEKYYDSPTETRFTVFNNGNNPSVSPLKEDSASYYGLVHEVFFDGDNAVPELVPGWIVSGTIARVGVYVQAPTEAAIKSDLQFYNYYCYFGGPQRILVGYEIDTHGLSIDEPDKPLAGSDFSWLYPDEVRAIWKKDPSYVIKPQDTVVLADACISLWDADETGGGEMASAWVDMNWPGYTGAAAYVGSTINIPIAMDAFTWEFWQSLCFQEQSVGAAEADASIARGLAGTAFQVYGRANFIIPN